MPEKRKKLLEVKHLKQYFGVGKPSMVKPLMMLVSTFLKGKHLA